MKKLYCNGRSFGVNRLEIKVKKGFSLLFLLCSIALIKPGISSAADLVVAEKGLSPYQIVIPDKAQDEVVDRWLKNTANLMQTAFGKSGFKVSVARESAKAANKPCIYLGATAFAKEHHIQVNTNDWTYVWKTVGKDLVIVGSDRKDPDRTSSRGETIQLALLGTVKGSLDFLRQYVGVRFLFNDNVNMGLPKTFDKNGMVPIDTRSIAFAPVQRIAIAANGRCCMNSYGYDLHGSLEVCTPRTHQSARQSART